MSLKNILSMSVLALGVTICFAPLPVVAASSSADLKALDPDADGTITLDEAQAAGTKKFAAADTDHDGTLDAKEARRPVAGADPDKDGTLDAKEYAAQIEAAFKKADADGDGTLDAKELHTAAGKALLKLIK